VSKVTAYVSHESCSLHDTGWSHPDHQGRLPAVTRAVYRDMVALYEPLLQLEGVPASEPQLLRVHTRRYVDDVRRTAIAAAAEGRPLELGGVPVSGASWDAALAAAGSVITAVDAVMAGEVTNAFAAVRPPGRGARADEPGEHSLFNHVAVAARHLREAHGSARVLIVAWGAHPATAIREVVLGDPGIAVVSLHQHPDEPAETHRNDVPLHAASDGPAFTRAMRDALQALPPEEAPDFVLLSAGFDILAGDPLGGLAVTPREVYDLTRALVAWAEARAGGRLVSVLEGGYHAARTAEAVVQHLRALTGLPPA
jgi:acetoin utilization deacetylase AcuC-like enzyme